MFGFPQAPHLPYPCLHGGHLSSYPASGVPAVPSVLHSPPPPGGGKGAGAQSAYSNGLRLCSAQVSTLCCQAKRSAPGNGASLASV